MHTHQHRWILILPVVSKVGIFIIPFYRWQNYSPDRLSDLLKSHRGRASLSDLKTNTFNGTKDWSELPSWYTNASRSNLKEFWVSEMTVKYDSAYYKFGTLRFSCCARDILGVCHPQLITFLCWWSCLGCFPGSGYEMWDQHGILSGIYQVANEMGFIKEIVKWGEQGTSTKNQTSFLWSFLPTPAGRWDTTTQLKSENSQGEMHSSWRLSPLANFAQSH